MLIDLAKNISDLAEDINELLDEDIIDDASKEDLVYELENLSKRIEEYLEEDN